MSSKSHKSKARRKVNILSFRRRLPRHAQYSPHGGQMRERRSSPHLRDGRRRRPLKKHKNFTIKPTSPHRLCGSDQSHAKIPARSFRILVAASPAPKRRLICVNTVNLSLKSEQDLEEGVVGLQLGQLVVVLRRALLESPLVLRPLK